MWRTAMRRSAATTLISTVATGIITTRVAAQGTAPVPATCADMQRYAGQRIAWVDVVTHAPAPLPGPAAVLGRLHSTTRAAVIRRQLLFHAGDTLQPDRIAESLRRLRALPYLAEIALTLSPASVHDSLAQVGRLASGTCAARPAAGSTPGAPVGLTVVTRDAWTTRPSARLGGAQTGSMLGLQERNLLGMGRVGRVYLRSDHGRIGLGLAYVDPWFLGRDVVMGVSRESFRDGTAARLSVRTHERSVLDRRIAQLDLSRTVRTAMPGALTATDTVRTDGAQLLVERRITASPAGVTRLLLGAEGERVHEATAATDAVVGPLHVRRTFLGADLGIARHTARYAVNDWLLPRRVVNDSTAAAISDIPLGGEGEVVAGIGHDLVAGNPAVRLDAWGGWTWSGASAWLVTADAWGSGYRSGRDWSAASVRTRVAAYHGARRGLWRAVFSAEELSDPDPTVRALMSADPTLPALPPRNRLAEAATAGVVERTMHLRPVTRGYMLDAALFGAGSLRWDPTGTAADRLGVAVVGAGLHFTPFRQRLATVQLDLNLPIAHTAGIASRPFVALSIVPWLEAGRQRNGRAPQ